MEVPVGLSMTTGYRFVLTLPPFKMDPPRTQHTIPNTRATHNHTSRLAPTLLAFPNHSCQPSVPLSDPVWELNVLDLGSWDLRTWTEDHNVPRDVQTLQYWVMMTCSHSKTSGQLWWPSVQSNSHHRINKRVANSVHDGKRIFLSVATSDGPSNREVISVRSFPDDIQVTLCGCRKMLGFTRNIDAMFKLSETANYV